MGITEPSGNRNLLFGKLYAETGLSKNRFSHPNPFGVSHMRSSFRGVGGAGAPAIDSSSTGTIVSALEGQASPALRSMPPSNMRQMAMT